MCSAVIDRSRIGSGARPDDLMKPNQIRMKADRWHCLFTSTHTAATRREPGHFWAEPPSTAEGTGTAAFTPNLTPPPPSSDAGN